MHGAVVNPRLANWYDAQLAAICDCAVERLRVARFPVKQSYADS
jgi:hypothetical protein